MPINCAHSVPIFTIRLHCIGHPTRDRLNVLTMLKSLIISLTFVIFQIQHVVLANSNPSMKTYTKSKTPFQRVPLDQLPPLDLRKYPDANLFIKALTNQPMRRAPVWCMRQAGRHLPEFRALSEQGYDFFTMCEIPELAVEISLQPLRRYGVDAVIIFSDILVIPQAMGMEIKMVKGKGPVFSNPLLEPRDIHAQGINLNPDVEKELGYVMDAINLARQEINGQVPLIGFCGGPLSLLMYMVEGQTSKAMPRLRTWLYKHSKESHGILQSLSEICAHFLVAQQRAGAQALQVFESVAAEGVTQDQFYEFVFPYLKQIADRVKVECPGTPLILFSKGTDYALEKMSAETKYDCFSLDWKSNPENAREKVGNEKALQGNMDPCCIYADKVRIELEVEKMLKRFGTRRNYIANFGHGCSPDMDPENVKCFINCVQQSSQSNESAHNQA